MGHCRVCALLENKGQRREEKEGKKEGLHWMAMAVCVIPSFSTATTLEIRQYGLPLYISFGVISTRGVETRNLRFCPSPSSFNVFATSTNDHKRRC